MEGLRSHMIPLEIFSLTFFMVSDALPKTRSGKSMRRVLKVITLMGDIGNVMPSVNPKVVQELGKI